MYNDFLKYLIENIDNPEINKENMPLIVRRDIINTEIYFYLEHKYKFFIAFIYSCCGYCFYNHAYIFFGNKATALEAINHLEQLHVIGIERLNNNKYIYLKHIAIKYLSFKDDMKIYNYRPNLPNRQHFFNKPSDIVLKRAAAIAAYNLSFSNDKISFAKEKGTFLINNFHDLKKDFDLNISITHFKFLFERSNIYLSSIDNDIFSFFIFDFSNLNQENIISSLIKISAFLESFGSSATDKVPDFLKAQISSDFKSIRNNKYKFNLEICTVNNIREQVLTNLIPSIISNLNKKNKYIVDCQVQSNLLRYNSPEDLTIKRNTLKEQYISGLLNISVNTKIKNVDSLFKNSSQKVKTFLKRKDIDRFEELKKYLNDNK